MDIQRVDLQHEKQVNQFIEFPFHLYRKCRQWVPPIISSMRKNMDPTRHPYYKHSQAEFYLARQGDTVLGRIAYLQNQHYIEHHQSNTAFFGFYECIEDENVSKALFETIFDHARSRGLDEMIGPMRLLATDGGGILVEGFEHRAAMDVAYNYSYYDRFIKEAGFEKDTDHLSGYASTNQHMPERFFEIAEKVKAKRGYWIKTFKNKDEMKEWIPVVAKVYSVAFAENYAFYPLTEDEMVMIGHQIIDIADPPLVKLVMKENDVVGFLLSYHDLSAGLQRARGKIFPYGWLFLVYEKWRTRWVIVNGVGLLPEHQGLGANTILYTELYKTINYYPFKHVDVVLVNESNLASRSDMENMGIRWYKRHRHYKRKL